MAQTYGLATNYSGVGDPSAPNYVALIGGSTYGITDDNPYYTHTVTNPSLVDQLEGAGLTWKGYFQSLPYAGYMGTCFPVRCNGVPDADAFYASKHNGFPYFAQVAAVSSNDVWAVGGSDPSTSSIAATLTMHWDGSQWNIVSSPNVGSFSNTFLGVAAVASNNVWAVGYAINANHLAQTLIEQWNGFSWNVVSSPNVSTSYNTLYSVSALSANDVWAVGYAQNASGAFQTLIEHWNGTAWSIVASPNPGTSNNYLFGVKAVAANNVLAAGQSLSASGPDQSLVEQWNGSTWSVVSTPTTTISGTLYGVAATTTNAWAIGMQASNTIGTQPLVQQTLRGRWSSDSIPEVGTFDNNLYGVAAVSDSDVWAVGTFIDNSGNAQTLIEQWNGTSWNVVSSPSPGSGDNILGGVAALSANDVWAVGGYDNGTGTLSLIEYYC